MRAVRWREWSASKIPFVWIACVAAALTSPLTDVEIVRRAAGVILFTCLCAAFGHVANDFADRDCDEAAGKRGPAGRLTKVRATIILLLLACAALTCLVLLAASRAAVWAGAVTVFVAAAYSLPPLRLKVRGAAGVWIAAAAQRTLPMFVAFIAIAPLNAAAWLLLAAAELAGTRWILVHQMLDADNDRKSGVATWVTVVGEERAASVLRNVVFPFELAFVMLAVLFEARQTPAMWWVALWALLGSGAWVWQCRGVQQPYSFDGYARQPLTGFYQVLWPLGLSIVLTFTRPALWFVAPAFIAWEHRYIAHRIVEWLRILRRQQREISPA
ncbi:MAG: UbiA family prenyltransferase [Acidobacteriota bacterium]|nr:UbiA family prenyltransferase [Acidobacteriota bacterium]